MTTDEPDSISELFRRYPDVTPEQARKVIVQLRKERQHIGEDQKPVKAPKAPKAIAAPRRKVESTADLLKELGLDL